MRHLERRSITVGVALAMWILAIAVAGRAEAGPPALVTLGDDVHVRSQPSRVATTLATVDQGEPVVILKKRGKWVKVRVKGAEGWVLRAQVGKPRPAPVAKREPVVAAPAPAPQPSAKDEEADKEGWRAGMMKDGEGADAAVAAPSAANDEEPELAVDKTARPAPRPRALSIGVGLGVSGLSGRFDGDGTSPLAHYSYGLDALGVGAFARGEHALGGHFIAGGDASFLELHSYPGIQYVAPDGSRDDIPVTLRSGGLGVFAGWRGGTTTVAARLGWELTFVDLDDLMNLAALPREQRQAGTVGVRVDEHDFLELFTLRIAGDVQLVGDVAQTSGREDGTASDTIGARLGLAAAWRSGMFDYAIDYRYTWTSTSFTGAPSRLPDGSQAERSERQHSVLFIVAVGR